MKKTTIFTAVLFLCLSFCFADANAVKLGHLNLTGTTASFPNAVVEGDGDGSGKFYAFSVSVDKGYVITSGLENPTYTDLADSNGNHKTAIWVFNDGIDAATAQAKVRALAFNYEEGMTLTLDINPNKIVIPAGVSAITQFIPDVAYKSDANGNETNEIIEGSGGTPHYYMYVESSGDWATAYKAAKGCSFLGMKGYLVTITSLAEDTIIDNISTAAAWAGGANLNLASGTTPAIDGDTFDTSSLYTGTDGTACAWSWICGPEAGYGIRYDSSSVFKSSHTPVKNYYASHQRWNNGEPNNSNPAEPCIQVHAGSGENAKWNDLPTSYSYVVGYFVEFSDYKYVDGYIEPASVTLKFNQIRDTTNGQDYSSIEDAVVKADSGDELLLLADQTATTQDTENKILTINTEGKNLTGTFAVTGGSFTVKGNTDTVQLTSAGVNGGAFTLNGGKCDAVTVENGTFTVDGLVTIPSLTLVQGNKVTFGRNANSSSVITLSSELPTGVITENFPGALGDVINLPSGVTEYLLMKTKSGELKVSKHKTSW